MKARKENVAKNVAKKNYIAANSVVKHSLCRFSHRYNTKYKMNFLCSEFIQQHLCGELFFWSVFIYIVITDALPRLSQR